ncbi:MAG: glycosyltransferase family 9 protein [Candidatus Omnitrophota bacterium]
MQFEPENIKRILVINLGGIGDLLISTPALRALKEHFSGSKLYLLVSGRASEAARDLAYVDKVFVFEVKHPWENLFSNLNNLFELRRLRVDLAVNMRTLVSGSSAGKMKFILKLINPGVKAGRDTSGRGGFFDVKIPEEDIGDKYEMEYDLEIARVLGAEITSKEIDFTFDEESLKQVDKFLDDNGVGHSDILVGIHPGGKPSHRWPADNFVEMIKLLHSVPNRKFVITGSKDEAMLAQSIIDKSGVSILNLAGKLSVRGLAALLKRCSAYITNDTGSMHIAAIAGSPLVAIFGPGYYKRYDPRNISGKAVVFYKKQECAPCNKFDCASLKCLSVISAQEVVDAVEVLLTAA